MWKFLFKNVPKPLWQTKPYRIGRVSSGKTVLVTGATSMLGRKVCRTLIDRGDRLIVLVRNRKKAQNFFGPHAMIITDLSVIGHGTPIDSIYHLRGAWRWWFWGKTQKIISLVTGKSGRRNNAASLFSSWTAPFV